MSVSVKVLKNMLTIYKKNKTQKKMLDSFLRYPEDSRFLINTFIFFFVVFLVSLISILGMSQVGKGLILFNFFLCGFLIYKILNFHLNADSVGYRYALKKIKFYLKIIPFRLYWKATNFIRQIFLDVLIRSTSELLKSCSVEICDFFEKKKKTYILNALIQEMRLPKKSTEDYTVELEDLIYPMPAKNLFL